MQQGNEAWAATIGALAAACSTLAFVPQIVRIRGRGSSRVLPGISLAGLLLWLSYGLLTGARAVSTASAACAMLLATAIVLKARGEKRPTASHPKRLRIAIDMDDVIADFRAKERRACDAALGARSGAGVAERRATLDALVQAPGFFADLDVTAGSREVVRELAERHEVFIASAAMEVPASFADKYAWLRRHFGFIPPSHYVFCGDKSVLSSDVLIDDTPRHFERFRGRALLFSAPHNEAERRYERVDSWADVRRLLLSAPGPSTQAPTGRA
jgi:5'-nucleotidase